MDLPLPQEPSPEHSLGINPARAGRLHGGPAKTYAPSKTNAMDETELMLAALNGDLMLVDQLRHTQVGMSTSLVKQR